MLFHACECSHHCLQASGPHSLAARYSLPATQPTNSRTTLLSRPCCHAMLQLKDETERLKEQASEARENAKRQKEHEKQWEGSRESRVAGWRDYMKKVRRGGGVPTWPCVFLAKCVHSAGHPSTVAVTLSELLTAACMRCMFTSCLPYTYQASMSSQHDRKHCCSPPARVHCCCRAAAARRLAAAASSRPSRKPTTMTSCMCSGPWGSSSGRPRPSQQDPSRSPRTDAGVHGAWRVRIGWLSLTQSMELLLVLL
jgi:hypothetical protein